MQEGFRAMIVGIAFMSEVIPSVVFLSRGYLAYP
jgi:hypothetical protein